MEKMRAAASDGFGGGPHKGRDSRCLPPSPELSLGFPYLEVKETPGISAAAKPFVINRK